MFNSLKWKKSHKSGRTTECNWLSLPTKYTLRLSLNLNRSLNINVTFSVTVVLNLLETFIKHWTQNSKPTASYDSSD